MVTVLDDNRWKRQVATETSAARTFQAVHRSRSSPSQIAKVYRPPEAYLMDDKIRYFIGSEHLNNNKSEWCATVLQPGEMMDFNLSPQRRQFADNYDQSGSMRVLATEKRCRKCKRLRSASTGRSDQKR
mmetsp:Transcript_31049/g.69825  ORF Transcript_31049/g.69825 Transcript_31049/m.69825 type:complete len:129 (-) Transcript_31049:51-437(-)